LNHKFVTANGLKFCYDEFGDPDRPAMLLIMGLGTQMIAWPEPFCERLAEGGFRVIRFDNRDIGLSESLSGEPVPNVPILAVASRFGLRLRVPYTLHDMKRDTVALLDSLDIGGAHLVGASMGGMIAHLAASEHPDRVASLTSIMSTSGAHHLPGPPADVRRHLISAPPPDEDRYVERRMRTLELVGSRTYPADRDTLRERLRAAYRRSFRPEGYMRQLAAVIASGDRVAALRKIRVPTLVIHGTEDRLVPAAASEHIAQLVPNSRLELIEGMGHDLPEPLWPRLADLIIGHASEP
jgi:pimeloyl-ACP methyl ester carboxylesterase